MLRRIWTIAQNTLSQAIRMRVAVIVIVLLLILLPLMSITATGDQSALGKVQTFVSYSMSLTSLLLCVLTIVVSVYTVTNDLRRKHIYLVVSKPVRRFEIVAGKMLGVVVLDGLLLALFGVIIYSLALFMPRLSRAEGAELEKVNREFFTSRTRLETSLDTEQIEQQARRRYEQLKEEKRLPDDMTRQEVMAVLQNEALSAAKSIPLGYVRKWEFENVRVGDPNDMIFIRYKLRGLPTPIDDQVYSNWRIGDFRSVDASGRLQMKTRPYYISRTDPVRTFVEFSVPGDVVAEDGYVSVEFQNNPAFSMVTVVVEDVQLLYRSSTFTANFIRAELLIFSRLIFLAAIGVSASTWLSFPVAVLVCMAAFLTGTVNGFIVESFDFANAAFTILYQLILRPILLWILPKFDEGYNPTRFIIEGRTLGWLFLGKVYLFTIFVKGGVLFLLGVLIFNNRELAKTSV
ncbi:MAG: ABC transporter permease [Sedimentisphaerales bacterium]|nr:ABC transporter permease [Sedimentisphaerales bacterium]